MNNSHVTTNKKPKLVVSRRSTVKANKAAEKAFLNHHYKIQDKFVLKSCQYLHRRISSPMMMMMTATDGNDKDDSSTKNFHRLPYEQNHKTATTESMNNNGYSSSSSSSNAKFPPMRSLLPRGCGEVRVPVDRSSDASSLPSNMEQDDDDDVSNKKSHSHSSRHCHRRHALLIKDEMKIQTIAAATAYNHDGTIIFPQGSTANASAAAAGGGTAGSDSLSQEAAKALQLPPPPAAETSLWFSASLHGTETTNTNTATTNNSTTLKDTLPCIISGGDINDKDESSSLLSTAAATATVPEVATEAPVAETTSPETFPMIRWGDDGGGNSPSSSTLTTATTTTTNIDTNNSCIHQSIARRTKIYSKLNLLRFPFSSPTTPPTARSTTAITTTSLRSSTVTQEQQQQQSSSEDDSITKEKN